MPKETYVTEQELAGRWALKSGLMNKAFGSVATRQIDRLANINRDQLKR